MRVTVTGVAGFIGSHLAASLLDEHDVVGIDNCRSGDWSRVPAGVTAHDLDITEPDVQQWAELLTGTEVLFHLAAEKYNSSKSTPQRVIDTNITAMATMLQGAGRAGVRHVVFTSSLYAYGALELPPMREDQVLKPRTYYGMSKVAGENLLRVAQKELGVSWACARLFFVYGPNQHAEGGYKSVIMTNFERMKRGEAPVINGSGTQRLDYVHVDDVVRGLVQLAGPAYAELTVNLGSGLAPTIGELTGLMQAIAGREGNPQRAPSDWTDFTARVADVGLARSAMGWEARTDLEPGLRGVWEWLNGR